MDLTANLAIICVFVVVPVTVFGFILLGKKEKNKIEKLRYQKEILELELEKEAYKIKLLEEENKKYDRIIGSNRGD